MGAKTAIEWTDRTFNIAWGCTKISPGCKFCYADTLATRYGQKVWGPKAARRTFGEKHWNEPLKWNKQAEESGTRLKVFCSSMCDIGEDHPTVEAELEKLWPLIRATPWLDWQLLTKRIERFAELLPPDWGTGYPNVWLGTSAENQDMLERRSLALIDIPAAVHFLSLEPLLGELDFEIDEDELGTTYNILTGKFSGNDDGPGTKIDWVILGGESGNSARPLNPVWAYSILDACKSAGTPFFFKQWGTWLPEVALTEYPDKPKWPYHSFGDGTGAFKVGKKIAGNLLEGIQHQEFPR